ILREQYSAQPDGLSGNEDCGQMSAWYVMSCLGIYNNALPIPTSPQPLPRRNSHSSKELLVRLYTS
ncbi:MAG: hypothetical protein EOO61_11460, partial [Hymenobacter sp.]